MPAFNFQKQFAEAVELGIKKQTIRMRRMNRPRIGQMAFLYTGMRTKKCRLLKASMIKKVSSVLMYALSEYVVVGNEQIEGDKLEQFAKADGFESWAAMYNWFHHTHGMPFFGDLISW
jgi:hypothetical protein